MQTKNEVLDIIKNLKKVIPSFFIVPVENDEEAKLMDENKIVGAFVIQDGKFKDHTIILRRIDVDGEKLEIEYSSVDSEKNNVESEDLNEVVGNIVNYFLATEALRNLNAEDGE